MCHKIFYILPKIQILPENIKMLYYLCLRVVFDFSRMYLYKLKSVIGLKNFNKMHYQSADTIGRLKQEV